MSVGYCEHCPANGGSCCVCGGSPPIPQPQPQPSRPLDLDTAARGLGATIQGGINWTWAIGFPTYDAAHSFVKLVIAAKGEHRGVYITPRGGKTAYDVRYR